MRIAIIPARGGSKRIPRKNIKVFHGKPMIAYSIEAALKSGCFDRIIVSTDDQEIADIALKYGAEVPFFRPSAIANDFATTMDVMEHAIQYLATQNISPEFVCCIYATAPFIVSDDLRKGLDILKETKVEYAFSATSFPFPIQRAIKLTEKGTVKMFSEQYADTRSQDLIEAYHDAGQFYWGKTSAFIARKAIFDEHSKVVLLPRKRVQDIDTVEDWELAEALFAIL
ncbi:MAG: N-acylneuraminate cytidylyltransferase [Cognaticolwellia sp.]|jgi:N-acylneuraminate cytidylyltransferase